MPVNVDVIRSLSLITEVQRLSCRHHPGSTEDLCCLSCLTLLCAKCFINDHNDHAQHEVTLVEVAAKNFRCQLDKNMDEVGTLNAHLARAGVALKVFKNRALEIQRQVLEEERSKTKRIEKDTAMLLEQLANRLDPLSKKVDDGQKSVNEVIQQCKTIRDNPRELVRHFPAVQAKLESLSQLTADIDVDDIEREQVDFTPLSLADLIDDNSFNFVGRLTPSSSDDISDNRPTLKELRTQLDELRMRESSLLMELQKMKEHERVVDNHFSEQAMQHRQQGARMAERENQLCQYIEMLRMKLVKLEHSERNLANSVEIALMEKKEIEKKMAVQEERLAEASRRISELEIQSEELKSQINGSELRQKDLNEQLRSETQWRRNAEVESRRHRYENEDLITELGEERQNAQRKYEKLQDTVTTLLKKAKEQTRQAVWTAAVARETNICRQAEAKLSEFTDQISQLTTKLERTQHFEADFHQKLETPRLQAQSLDEQCKHPSSVDQAVHVV